ncbi:MAG: NAD-dependent epimerase/dehydratase family protein [Porphyromonadaceae bacterium]|jgi:nucleoside-diphosphate-sugar epimerase|nr:NAD-dependent epimerase/dehydratase family protein [Porphyromonadaceae bacterium]
MKILITGINGFVGRNIVNAWKNNYIIFGLDLHNKRIDGVHEIYSWENLSDVPEVDTIIHLAAIAHDTEEKTNYKEYFDVNTGLTKIIFDYFLASKAKNFIFFSSVKAAADSVGDEVLTEDIVPKPVGPYAESKKEAEDYILSKLSEAEEKNKNVYILRPCLIHGPGNKGNLNLLYKVASKKTPWPLGAYDNRRSFCSIENMIFVIEEIIKRNNILSGIYNVCDDETLSTNELIQLICKSVGKKEIIWNLPKAIINNAALVSGALHLPFDKVKLRKLTENYVVSNKKIKKTLDISKMPVTATDGMKKTIDSFK